MLKQPRMSAAKKSSRVVPPKLKTAKGRVAAVRRATGRVRTKVAIDVKKATRK